jgi:hypothetical protein
VTQPLPDPLFPHLEDDVKKSRVCLALGAASLALGATFALPADAAPSPGPSTASATASPKEIKPCPQDPSTLKVGDTIAVPVSDSNGEPKPGDCFITSSTPGDTATLVRDSVDGGKTWVMKEN